MVAKSCDKLNSRLQKNTRISNKLHGNWHYLCL